MKSNQKNQWMQAFVAVEMSVLMLNKHLFSL